MNKALTAILALALTMISLQSMAGETPAVGTAAPGFRLQDQNGEWHDLEDYRGSWLAVYFYPKDDTPGCTTEACNFRDNIYAFKAIGAAVVGISVDDVESHREFSDKYKLPFIILADETGATAEAYGVLRDWKLMKIAARDSRSWSTRRASSSSTTRRSIRTPTRRRCWPISKP